ncbi:hypothetical protein NIES4071_13350 [Calothrix sp. NIES-4071]|nr:hypothetical protein NIES4071_13350 [Calothrix sp. NIES-4071]BAZ55675.1 hypothetical protein NIES4105_13310 [Calothrix sp. NIES-4105]
MLQIVLKVFLSFLFCAAIGFNTNAKAEARNASTFARRLTRASTKYYVFDSYREYLISPNKRYTVVWGQNRYSNRIRNYLYDIRAEKPIVRLHSCRGNSQDGNISTNWRADSQVALITYNGRWEPRDACLVSVNGAQINIYNQIQSDITGYLIDSCDLLFLKYRDKLAVDFFRNQYLLKISSNQLTLLATLYVPNSRTYNQSFLMTYNYQVTGKRINFRLASIQKT